MTDQAELMPRGQRDNHLRHGHARHVGGKASPTYHSWRAMLTRCRNHNRDDKRWYREMGITVCERWLTFDHFLADMGERPAGRTLERTDNLRGYEPGNCIWATNEQQARNRRTTKLTFDKAVAIKTRLLAGETCRALSREYAVSENTIHHIKTGRTWKDACAKATEAHP